jgi:thioredoxin reductase
MAVGQREVTGYGAEPVGDQVPGIEPGSLVPLASGRTFTARRILLATGGGHELPDIPGVGQRWARDLLHCPYCHVISHWEFSAPSLARCSTLS